MPMGKRLSEQNWDYLTGLDALDHEAAHMIAEEFTWSWTTCWFADTGQFDHPMQFSEQPSLAMERALFGWWMDTPDADGVCPSDKEPRTMYVRALMRDYLTDREARDDMGPVDGFAQMWRKEEGCPS